MFELQVIDPVPGLEGLGASVQLREQPYGVVRPIITSEHERKNELLFVASLFVDGQPLGTLEALDELPGALVVALMKAINLSNSLYGLSRAAADADAEAGEEASPPGEA